MSVEDVKVIEFPRIDDGRGSLSFAECHSHVPFQIQRVFYIYDVPENTTRGGHSLKNCEQVILALHGAFDLIVDDGKNRRRIHLDRPEIGVYVPSAIWREMEGFTESTVCLVLASSPYDATGYHRRYEDFKASISNHFSS